MKKDELAKAVDLAKSKEQFDADDTVLYGLYLPDFVAPVATTIKVVAKFIRWHCVNLDGTIASEDLAEFARQARRKIIIVG